MLSEVKYIDQNIVYKDDGSVWAFYRLPMQEVMSVDFEKKEQYSMMNTRLFEEFTRYGYVCLAMLPDRVNLEDIFIKMEESFVEDAFDYGCSLLDRTYRDFTKEREGIFGYEWILSVPLSNVLSWTKEWKQNVAMMKEYVLKGLGLYSVKINRHSPYLSITLHKCYPYYLFGISTFPNLAYHSTARRKFSITIV